MALLLATTLMFLLLSALPQRLAARRLKVHGAVRPLLPFAEDTPFARQLAVRASGMLFTFVLLVLAGALQFGNDCRYGTRVEVIDGLAAAQAGLKSGDVVRAIGTEPVADFGELKRTSALLSVTRANFVVEREGVSIPLGVETRGLLGLKPMDPPGTCERPVVGAALGFPFRFLATLFALVPSRLLPSVVLSTSLLSAGWWFAVLLEVLALGINALSQRSSL
ncbi:MAG: site-2 protease family protein [Myxococcaceae bacterium]